MRDRSIANARDWDAGVVGVKRGCRNAVGILRPRWVAVDVILLIGELALVLAMLVECAAGGVEELCVGQI